MIKAMAAAVDQEEYLEIDDVCAAIVAAEVVATLRGAKAPGAPPGLIDGALAKSREQLYALHELAFAALKTLLNGRNELWEAGEPVELNKMGDDLLARLASPPDLQAVDRMLSDRPRRPRRGDVLRIPLGDGKYAFGRIYRNNTFYAYSGVYADGEPPPIGSRRFLFYANCPREVIGTSVCPIVGADPLGREECRRPAVYNGPKPLTAIYGLPAPFPDAVDALPYQCIGMERLRWDTLGSLQERLRSGETSLQRSIADFGTLLSPRDIERGIEALQEAHVRCFDAAENLRFNLIPPFRT